MRNVPLSSFVLSGSFARQTRPLTLSRVNNVRSAAHGEHDDKLQNTTNRFRSSRAPGNLVRRTHAADALPRATNSPRRAGADSTFAGPPPPGLPAAVHPAAARPASPPRPADRGDRPPPSTSPQADRPLQNTTHPIPRRARPVLLVPGRSPAHRRERTAHRCPVRRPTRATRRATGRAASPGRQPAVPRPHRSIRRPIPRPPEFALPAAAAHRGESRHAAAPSPPRERRGSQPLRERWKTLDHPIRQARTRTDISSSISSPDISSKYSVSYRSIGHISVSIS